MYALIINTFYLCYSFGFSIIKEAIDGTAKKRRLERFGAVPHSEVRIDQKSCSF